MNENKNNYVDVDEIDLRELFLAIWIKKYFIFVFTTIFAISSVTYALMLPNIYTSKSILAPVAAEESLSSKLGSFSSLASISGINLPTDGSSNTKEAIERIKSFEFFSIYFLPNIKLENITAIKKWDPINNRIIYDDSIFNKDTNKFEENAYFRSNNGNPSKQEAFKIYKDILSISQNSETQFITLSIKHMSPIITKKWVDIIIYNINKSMREEDEEKAKNAINYLNESAGSTNIQSLKEAISGLLEGQMQILMLAASNEHYVLEILDSPIVPEEKSEPGRAFISIIGTILGSLISILIVLISYFIRRDDSIK